MPIRAFALLAVLAAPVAAPVAALADAGPVCGRPEVLDVVDGILAARGSAARIEAGMVGQAPAANPAAALCAVRLLDRYYDTSRFGPVPQYVERTFRFTVRRARNGLFVDASGGAE